MKFKQKLKSLLPLVMTDWIQSMRSPWSGDYASWGEAVRDCDGYDNDLIIKSVLDAAEKIKNGDYPYERDSVLFEKVVYSWPLSTAIFWAALSKKKLNVVDFGGGLGSSFYQNRIFLDDIKDVNWQIIEQKKFVDVGRQKFHTEHLSFYESVDLLPKNKQVDLVLVSSTLQYLVRPYAILGELLNLKPRFILLDRLLVVARERELITKQTVRNFTYEASYPCRFLVKKEVIDFVTRNGAYKLVSEFDSYIYNKGIIDHKYSYDDIGLLFKKNN